MDDLNDDSHEFSYDEYKTAMLRLCSELGVPIMVNGRNIAARMMEKIAMTERMANDNINVMQSPRQSPYRLIQFSSPHAASGDETHNCVLSMQTLPPQLLRSGIGNKRGGTNAAGSAR